MTRVLPPVALRCMTHFLFLGICEHKPVFPHDSHFSVCVSYEA